MNATMFLRHMFPPMFLLVFGAASHSYALTVTPVYPAPGEIIEAGEFMIAASVEGFQGEDTLPQRRTSAVVFIDNETAPGPVRYDQGMVRWTPPPGYRDRVPGNHAITVVVKAPDATEAAGQPGNARCLNPAPRIR